MHLLLIAPDRTGPQLNVIPEIRDISRLHQTAVLNGTVTALDVENAIRNADHDYQVIHFATHLHSEGTDKLDRIALSDGESLSLRDVAQLARMAGARLVFFNICLAARFGAYLVRHGVPAVIFTTVDIPDATAWRFPLNFYQRILRLEERGGVIDFKAAFDKVDAGDGVYGWSANGNYYTSLLAPIEEAIKSIRGQLDELSSSVKHNREMIGQSPPPARKWADRLAYLFAFVLLVSMLLSLYSSLLS